MSKFINFCGKERLGGLVINSCTFSGFCFTKLFFFLPAFSMQWSRLLPSADCNAGIAGQGRVFFLQWGVRQGAGAAPSFFPVGIHVSGKGKARKPPAFRVQGGAGFSCCRLCRHNPKGESNSADLFYLG